MSSTRILTRREARIVQTFAEHAIPEGGGIDYSAKDVDIVGFVDDFLADIDRITRLGLRFMIFYLQFYPILGGYRFRRFTRLSPEHQNEALYRMKMSPRYFVRSCFLALNSPVQICFYSDRRVMDAIGYDGYQPGVQKAAS